MADKQEQKQSQKEKDERVRIPLDPEEALRGLLKVDPRSDPAEKDKEGSDAESSG